jgi:hypothetical protein
MSLDYYPDLPDGKMRPRAYVTGGLSFVPSQSTNVSIHGNWKNLPEFSYEDLFEPEFIEGIPLTQIPSLTVERYKRYEVGVDVSQQLSKRARVFTNAMYARGKLPSRGWTTIRYSGSFSYNLSKGMAAFIGYEGGGQRDDGAERYRTPKLDFGVNYERPLSLSRRTTLSFTTGLAGTDYRAEHRTKYDVIGSVHLNHEIGRSWNARLSYVRNVRYIEQYSEPMLSDSGMVGVQGSISRRLLLTAAFGSTIGQLGTVNATGADSYNGLVQASFALTRYLAFALDYSYYRYAFAGGSSPLADLGKADQQIISASLQLWTPLIKQSKR